MATGIYSVGPNQRAIVRRGGKVLAEMREPGLHFGLPWPIDRVTRVKMEERKRVGVGIGLLDRSQGRRIEPRQLERLTGDRNLVVISAIVQYRIADAEDYLFRAADVPSLIESVTAAALSSIVSSMHIDDVLTARRVAIQDEVRRVSQQTLDRYGVGVRVTGVSLEEVKPPSDVAGAFRDVISAREDRLRMINEALGYANQLLPAARGLAAGRRLEAEGLAERTTRMAEGEAERFRNIVDELAGDRQLAARRLILETLERVLPRLKKVVLDGRVAEDLDLGLFEEE